MEGGLLCVKEELKKRCFTRSNYKSKVVTKLINQIMLDGKKGTAQTILYDAFDMVKEKTGEEPTEVFNKALENIKPALEVKTRRVGGANYPVPIEVRPDRAQALGLRWLVQYARLRGGHSMAENLANEILMLLTVLELQLKNVRKLTEWQKLIKHLLIIDGNYKKGNKIWLVNIV